MLGYDDAYIPCDKFTKVLNEAYSHLWWPFMVINSNNKIDDHCIANQILENALAHHNVLALMPRSCLNRKKLHSELAKLELSVATLTLPSPHDKETAECIIMVEDESSMNHPQDPISNNLT